MNRFYLMVAVYLFVVAPAYIVDPTLSPYKTRFDEQVSKYCKKPWLNKFSLTFSPDMGDVAGECDRSMLGHSATIEINKKYWGVINENERNALVSHELTHCYFSVEHSENPSHYMYKETGDISNLEEQIKNTLIDICILDKKEL